MAATSVAVKRIEISLARWRRPPLPCVGAPRRSQSLEVRPVELDLGGVLAQEAHTQPRWSRGPLCGQEYRNVPLLSTINDHLVARVRIGFIEIMDQQGRER